jgi:sugar phosphate isomerase/epimerase
VSLAYHHHDFEVREIEGSSGLRTICASVDAALLSIEVDVYWLHAAEEDPVSYLAWLGDRCLLLHLKDHLGSNARPPEVEDNEGVARFNVELGDGVIDLDGVLAATEATAHWYIVEQDLSQQPLASARRSMAFLASRGLGRQECRTSMPRRQRGPTRGPTTHGEEEHRR